MYLPWFLACSMGKTALIEAILFVAWQSVACRMQVLLTEDVLTLVHWSSPWELQH